jgi:hypothetical protein
MREVWRKLGSPQTHHQRSFLYNYFKPYYITRNNCLHSSYVQTFKIPKFDYFINIQHAMKYFMEIIDDPQMKQNFKINSPSSKQNCIENTLYNICFHKIKNNTYILSKLLHTGMKPIVHCDDERYNLSKIITELRSYFYRNDFHKQFEIL